MTTYPPGDFGHRRPHAPPPQIIPEYCPSLHGTGPMFIRAHLNYYTYVWMDTGEQFWMFPLYATNGDILGYAWSGDAWVPVRVSVKNIESVY